MLRAPDTGSPSGKGRVAVPAVANPVVLWSIGLFLTAIGLFAVHGLFHLWEWLWWPPPDTLSALYGATDAGRLVHAVTEVIIALALFLGLWRAIGRSG